MGGQRKSVSRRRFHAAEPTIAYIVDWSAGREGAMRIVIAQMSHETNTFSPVITDLARFSGGRKRPLQGDDAIKFIEIRPVALAATSPLLKSSTVTSKSPSRPAQPLWSG
ncbi:MAG: hypothetical protein Ct9H300mP8_02680 [Gammaproteobacteria bacterium]|nr:MAG: hypothetical protein Ct9H300mP8_02680 [Gammaproteobacteria bacterium]